MRKLTVIISLIICALLVFGCASAPEQPAAPVIPTTQITDPPQIQEAESRLLAGMHRIRSIFAEIYQKMKEL